MWHQNFQILKIGSEKMISSFDLLMAFLAGYFIVVWFFLKVYMPECRCSKNICRFFWQGGQLSGPRCRKNKPVFERIKNTSGCCFTPGLTSAIRRALYLRLGVSLLVLLGMIKLIR